MMKYLAVVSVLTSVVLVQSSNTTTPNLIPSGISSSCTTFLTSLNVDTSMSTCLSSLIDATSAYVPGGNTTISPTTSQVMSTMNNLCSTTMTNKCPESSMRQMLTNFYSQCLAELTSSSVDSIRQMYDMLYVLTPFKNALCSKDDNGDYCAMSLPASNGLKNTTSSTTPSAIISQLAQNTPLTPNLAIFESTNLPFLFIQPTDGAQAALQSNSECTTCTRSILTAYINFESSTPYAPGLGTSGLLRTQQTLYNAVCNTCGSSFLSGVVQAAGGLSGGTMSSGAIQNVVFSPHGFFAIGMGLLAVVSRVASSALLI